MLRTGLMLAALFAVTPAFAAVKTQVVEYKYAETTLKGFLAYDDAIKEKRPGVLVIHEWWGLDDYAKMRAEMLAKLGYVAFCPDMYGEGKMTEHPKEAKEMSDATRKNVKVWQGRATAGLKTLADLPQVDSTKIAAIGYCFGGSTALQLAYTGADLKAVVTFHAALPGPTDAEAKAIKAKILVNHGGDDFFIPAAAIDAFKAKLQGAKVPMEFVSYPGAFHSFTVKGAEKRDIKGMAYNADADEKSWAAMQKLLKEVFAK
ncbi:dienelactone hydrolase family protein [Zavarzinella formosa]|uniref:dienelactone hydrolase family protein n=1 Tax=Zavarzinella formosa TaxID=360055 RepID=UPI00031414B2|nr:dienelactone hydrolase family protein [Zavarzinella formosa]